MSRREQPDIELHIEELVLHDASSIARDAIAAQLIAAVEPMLAARGLGAWAIDGATVEHLSATLAPPSAHLRAQPGAPIGEAIGSALTGKP